MLIKKIFYKIIFVILLIYLLAIGILVYCGPIKTLQIKRILKKDNIKVVLSFTTTPYRIDHIKPVLDAISRQSIKPKQIYVNVPWTFKRDRKSYIIPKWLHSYPGVIINRTEDYGPATKLLATLEQEKDPSTIIVTIDDDTIYPKHIIRDLIQPYFDNKHKQKKVVFTGFALNAIFSANNNFYIQFITLHESPSLLVVGAGGVAYKREFFQNDIFSLIKRAPLTCFLSDDLTISMYLYDHQVNILKSSNISYNGLLQALFPFKGLAVSYEKHALSRGANGLANGSNEANYYYCLDILSKNSKTKKIVDQFLNNNELIKGRLVEDNFKIVTNQLYFNLLLELVEFLPLLKSMVIFFLQ